MNEWTDSVHWFKFVRLYAESDTPFLYRHTGAWAENRSWPGEKPTSGGEGGDAGGGERGGGGGGETRGAGEGNGAAAAGGNGGGVEMGRPRRDAQGNISQVDVEHPDLEKFPLFAKARHMDVILGEERKYIDVDINFGGEVWVMMVVVGVVARHLAFHLYGIARNRAAAKEKQSIVSNDPS